MKVGIVMIRQLTKQDHDSLFPFLLKEASINLFIIGDIEAFGYDTSFQKLWGEWRNNELTAVLLKFYDSYIFYSQDKDNFDVEGFSTLLKQGKQPIQLSGKTELIERFENQSDLYLGAKKITYFAQCDSISSPSFDEVEIASIEDISRIIKLEDSIDEFHPSEDRKAMKQKAFETKTGRSFYVEGENKELLSVASTTAENSQSAMIVGVCTHKDYRNQGLASKVMKALVNEVLKEKNYVCLFYDNPNAGKLYKKIGFKDIGLWTMHRS